MNQPTLDTAQSLQNAFDFFNREIFHNELPPVLITLHRKNGARGYFSSEAFSNRKDDIERLDEIALNPDNFDDRTDKEILSTLVHEMCHHWQKHYGRKPAKNGYHNLEWASKMKTIGLKPISLTTGASGTGVKVTHEVVSFGQFDLTCDRFLGNGDFNLNWKSRKPASNGRKPTTKYTFRFECPTCGQKAKGAKDINIVCGECFERMECVDE